MLQDQLLKIMTEQYTQLKEQLKCLKEASDLIKFQQQSMNELKSLIFHTEQKQKQKQILEEVELQKQINQALRNQLKNPSKTTLETLEEELNTHLTSLISKLNLEKQVTTIIESEKLNIKTAIATEIELQIKPIVKEFLSEKEKTINYQNQLARLVAEISSKL